MKTTVSNIQVGVGDEIAIYDKAYRITSIKDAIKGIMVIEDGHVVESSTIYTLDLRLPGWRFIQYYINPQ
jgi:hypothetical protein